jgi:phosphate butyryltransferase
MGFAELRAQISTGRSRGLAVAWAVDPTVLRASASALAEGLVGHVAVSGPKPLIQAAAEKAGVDISSWTIAAADHPAEGAHKAVELVRSGECALLMKGSLGTAYLLRAVLHKEFGLRSSMLLSHVAVIELPGGRLTTLTDAAMNIRPDLEQKAAIVDNAIQLAWSIGLVEPKVAILAAVETVNPKMPETVDAAALTQMAARGQFSRKAVVDGPLAFDNAYSKASAVKKGISTPVAGEVDIFVVPEITAGNILYKAFSYAAGFKTAGLVVGAKCPIVLTSRADSEESKLNSILLASMAADQTV